MRADSLSPLAVSLAAVTALSLAGCPSKGRDPTPEPSPAAAASAKNVEKFGGVVSEKESVPVAKVLRDPEKFAESTVVVEGTVRSACSVKGCWMELAEGVEKNRQGARVTFKDYGFFVPKDSAGAKARVEGVVGVKTVSAGDVDHLEKEGAVFAHKYQGGTAREVRIVATGVELTR